MPPVLKILSLLKKKKNKRQKEKGMLSVNKSPTARFPAPLLIPFVLPVRCKGAGVCLQLLGGGASRGGEVSNRTEGWSWVLFPACSQLHKPCQTAKAMERARQVSADQTLYRGWNVEDQMCAPCAPFLRGLGCPINPDGICRLPNCSATSSQSLSGFRPFSSVRLSYHTSCFPERI